MNYKKLKEAFEQIGMGFNLLAQAIDEEKDNGRVEINEKAKSEVEATEETPKKSKKPSKVVKEEEEEEKVVELKTAKKTKKKATVEPKEEEETEVEEDGLTEEILNKMSYNEVKAKAKELGVKAVGSKKLIIENILALINPTDEKEEEIEDEDLEDEELENEEDNEEEEEEEEEEDEESLYDKIVADLEEYSDEDLKEILDDIGVSSKGKRQALLAKIVKAVEEGKLEWEDDEEDIEDSSDDDQEEEDFNGSNTRKAVMEDYEEKLREDIEEGEISDKKILKFLKSYYNDNYKSTGVESDREEYIRIQCELVDDEGELNDLEVAYYVGDDVYCCGEALKEVDGTLYCEHCGTEYDLED